MEKRFSILQALRFGFYTILEHFGFFIGLMGVYTASVLAFALVAFPLFLLPFSGRIMNMVQILRSAGVAHLDTAKTVFYQLGPSFNIMAICLLIIVFWFYRMLALGLTRVALDFHDQDASSLKQLFSCWQLAFKESVAFLLYCFIVALGMVLVIPGIYFAITLGFYKQFIVDQNAGIIESLRKSSRITKGSFLELFALGLIVYFIRWIGFSFIITLFIVIPLISLIEVYVYRKLQKSFPTDYNNHYTVN